MRRAVPRPCRCHDEGAACRPHGTSIRRPARPLYYFRDRGRSTGEKRPGPEALPLVVMARMSLELPGLIAAVPLYAVDRNGDQAVVRHLFSDGGISSNFPMHFFDALLPSRPTFGINRRQPHPVHPND